MASYFGLQVVGILLFIDVTSAWLMAAPEELQLLATPQTFIPGATPELRLKCSLPNTHRDMTSVSEFLVSYSRVSDTSGFRKLISFQDVEPYGNTTRYENWSFQQSIPRLNVGGGVSYFEVVYRDPTKNSEAWYKCDVTGKDNSGRTVHLTTPATRVVISPGYTIQPAGLDLSVTPITPGSSQWLHVTCSLSASTLSHTGMSKVNSLIISLSYDNARFVDLISVKEDGDVVHQQNSPFSVSWRGNIVQNGRSSLSASKYSPTVDAKAWYKCQAYGTDSVGRCLELTSKVISS